MKKLSVLVLLSALGFTTTACLAEDQATYRRRLEGYCEFLTPTLVTSLNGEVDGWKCGAAVDDYNRLFAVPITYMQAPTAPLAEVR